MADSSGKLSFLLVEDDAGYAEFLRLLVETCYPDAIVDIAGNAEDAVARLEAVTHDICFLDHVLEESTGLDVLRRTDLTSTPTAFIFLTAHAKQEIAREALELGALDYLIKGRFERFEFERSISYALYRRQKEMVFQRTVLRDSLTGLGNRELFREQARMIVAQTRRRTGRFALLYLDIDGFKAVNDTQGHQAGDDLLRQVAGRIQERIRESDAVSRVGGDEFAILLSNVRDAAAADAVVLDLKAAIAEPYTLDGHSAVVEASIGRAVFPDDSTDIDELTQIADNRMYEAKRQKPGHSGVGA